ncbi:aldehyde dehydrogenase family protein [Kibdelosporangium philippinense]|uniref:Aldehyde dehydrogenase family protein n=1 Tax=Kibdelosporangium philippinense TaxID=211113 RepID=A0ABS8ZMK1_9PSEU|nr:aldehyde dehydrogenase family protein [Kibdelosporangium philippinense]MCE7008769.1 aldehyde dehydrogenase family protein [Kibdelosporangium philippinense]
MSRYAAPGQPGSVVRFASRYDHFVGGEYVPPAAGRYFRTPTPVTGNDFTEIAEATADDLHRAIQDGRGAAPGWSRTALAERSVILSEIADRIEDNLEALAVAETWDTGKPIRHTLGADVPLASDHFRYFAGAIRALEGVRSETDGAIVVHGFREPHGVVVRSLGWDFPLLGAAWQLAPALATGNTVVLKPAIQTSASIHVLLSVINDLVPPGVINVVNGFPAAQPIGLGPAVFFADLEGAVHDRALDGFAIGTSAALIQDGRYEQFLGAALGRVDQLVTGHPLDLATTVGALVSADERAKALRHIDNAARSGARVRAGGVPASLSGELADGFFLEPTVIEGDKEHAFTTAPVVSVTRFNDFDDAVKLVNEMPESAGVSLWTRDTGVGYRAVRTIHAARIWVNSDHTYPAEIAFSQENRNSLLAEYWREKRLMVNYS